MTPKFINRWLVLGFDLLAIAVCFFLAYLIRFNLSINFNVSKVAFQLPLVILIGLIAFMVTGSYKGLLEQSGARDVYLIFKAVGLSSFIIILFMVINRTWEIDQALSTPLSIVIIYTLLSLVGLTASHYIFRLLYKARVKNPLK